MPQISNHRTTKNQMNTPTRKDQKTQNKISERAIKMRSLREETDETRTQRERESARCGERAVTGFENQTVGNGLFFQRYFKSIGSSYTS
jgi:hypothetical protein